MLCERTKTSIILPVPSLAVPPYLRPQDNWLALKHGRVPAGVVVHANATVRCRIQETAPLIPVLVRFLNNARANEHSINLTTYSWVTYTVQHDSALFVDRTLDAVTTQVEIEIDDDRYWLMPIYMFNSSDVNEFKAAYAASSSPYALLDLQEITILVPPGDKNRVLELDIDSLDKFYTQIVTLYDSMAGFISYDPQLASQSNFDKKFFAKADAGGPGAAYYGGSWTANSQSVLGNYLQVRPGNWLVFHEIGHAYDLVFTQGTNLHEVWNNVYGDRMQYQLMDAAVRQSSASVYENGNRVRVENNIMNLIDTNVNYSSWSFFQKLAMFTFIMNTRYGLDLWRNMNAEFRRLRSIETNPNYPNINVWLMDACPADLGALFDLFNVDVPEYSLVGDRGNMARIYPYLANAASYKPIVYPVKYLIKNFDILNSNYNFKEYLESNLDLVTHHDLIQTNIYYENITIKCVIDDVSQVAGQPFAIYDGLTLILNKAVDSAGMLVMPKIGPGVYTIRPPRGLNKRYHIKFADQQLRNNYLIVDGMARDYSLIYTEFTYSPYLFDGGRAFGINERFSTIFTVNYDIQQILVNVVNNQINPNYGNAIYFSISIDNPTSIFQLPGNGSNVPNGVYTLKFIPGVSVMTLGHTQASMNRLMFADTYVSNNSQFRLMADDAIPVNPNIMLPSRVDRAIVNLDYHSQWLDNHPTMLNIENEIRDAIFVTVQAFEGSTHQQLTQRYNKYYPDYYRSDGLYRIDMNGFGNLQRFRFECNLSLRRAHFARFNAPSGPNVNQGAVDYIGFDLITNTGDIVLTQLFRGNQSFGPAVFNNLHIDNGYKIALFHAEPNRQIIYKNNIPLTLTLQRNTLLEVIDLQLVLIE